MDNEKLQSMIGALKSALWLISEEYETLQDKEWKQNYDGVIKKLQEAIKQAETHD